MPISRPFALSDELLAMAITAKTFGQRPSALAGIRDAVLALEFDLASATTIWRQEHAPAEAEPEVLWDWRRGEERQPVRNVRLGLDY